MSLIAADEVAESRSPDQHATDPKATKAIEGRSPLQLAWARLRKDKVSMGALIVAVLLGLVAVFAPFLTDLLGHGPNEQFRETGLGPDGIATGPNGEFLLGADHLGRDVLARIIHGARISLIVGVVATAMAVLIGVIVGTAAGYYGGKVDTFLSRTMDVFLSFPFLLFAIALVSVFEPSVKISIFVIAFFVWANVGRVVRGQVLSIREREYVEAARSLGASDVRIMAIDVLPNLVAPVIVYSTLLIPTAIVFEATLSFLGLGVLPPTPTWGNMIAESSNGSYYQVAPWFLIFPGLALFITTLAFNLLGDGLRDALDPRAARVLARK
ncbi:MAG TPA: ABC transporter permease [Mycobacteriales bacterium]|nr:ABC transporter permease [Mycobacteriales bacterium]